MLASVCYGTRPIPPYLIRTVLRWISIRRNLPSRRYLDWSPLESFPSVARDVATSPIRHAVAFRSKQVRRRKSTLGAPFLSRNSVRARACNRHEERGVCPVASGSWNALSYQEPYVHVFQAFP